MNAGLARRQVLQQFRRFVVIGGGLAEAAKAGLSGGASWALIITVYIVNGDFWFTYAPMRVVCPTIRPLQSLIQLQLCLDSPLPHFRIRMLFRRVQEDPQGRNGGIDQPPVRHAGREHTANMANRG